MSFNYKKILRKRSTRMKILELFSFIPDRIMIRLQYRIKTGRKLNIKKPQRYTEKLQYYKMFYKNPLMIQCVDKYDVREYVKKKGLQQILIPCLGVYESQEEIDFGLLPNQFVMKDTLGGGGTSVEIVDNIENKDIERLRKVAKDWVDCKANIKNGGREWPYYSGKKHRVIIEKFIPSCCENGGLIDYKFFCFNGKVEYVYCIADRVLGKGAGLGIFSAEFVRLPYNRTDERPLERLIEKPRNYQKMITIAECLSKDFPHARIDLYNVDGKIMFGEITFFDGSGYMTYEPDEMDFIMGQKFDLDTINEKKVR